MPPLRINLLPAYIAERRKTQSAIIIFAILFLIATAAPLAWYVKLKGDVAKRQAEAEEMATRATELDKLKSEASQERSQIAPIEDKVNFVEAVLFYNGWRQKIYRRAAQYTYNKVEYNSMAVQGNTLSISAYANNVDDLGRYLITFFGNPDVEAVSVSNPPGYSPQQQQPLAVGERRPPSGFPFTVTARLIKSIQLPPLPASLGSTPGGGGGGGAMPPMGSMPAEGAEGPPPPTDSTER